MHFSPHKTFAKPNFWMSKIVHWLCPCLLAWSLPPLFPCWSIAMLYCNLLLLIVYKQNSMNLPSPLTEPKGKLKTSPHGDCGLKKRSFTGRVLAQFGNLFMCYVHLCYCYLLSISRIAWPWRRRLSTVLLLFA